jgi:hypothetical protein
MARAPAATTSPSAAEARGPDRRRRRKRIGLVLLAALTAVTCAYAAYLTWFAPPSLAIGTRATVTMRADPEMAKCKAYRNPAQYSFFQYAGVTFEPLDFFPAAWGTKGPWKGELTIIDHVDPGRGYRTGNGGPAVPNGRFTYRGWSIPVGGPPYLSAGLPPC